MKTHREIIDAFPNPPKKRHLALSKAINEKPSTVAAWHSRGRIPSRVWVPVSQAAKKLKVRGVSLKMLASAPEDAEVADA